MKRMHIHIAVKHLDDSIRFYSSLFGCPPTKRKSDYAKWMLDDPRVNFAISARGAQPGLDHLGIQAEDPSELAQLRERIEAAGLGVTESGETTCCYAQSDKSWIQDPTGIAWEAYHTMADAELFHAAPGEPNACCSPVVTPLTLSPNLGKAGPGCA